MVRCSDFTECNGKPLEDIKQRSDMISFTFLKDYSGCMRQIDFRGKERKQRSGKKQHYSQYSEGRSNPSVHDG